MHFQPKQAAESGALRITDHQLCTMGACEGNPGRKTSSLGISWRLSQRLHLMLLITQASTFPARTLSHAADRMCKKFMARRILQSLLFPPGLHCGENNHYGTSVYPVMSQGVKCGFFLGDCLYYSKFAEGDMCLMADSAENHHHLN